MVLVWIWKKYYSFSTYRTQISNWIPAFSGIRSFQGCSILMQHVESDDMRLMDAPSNCNLEFDSNVASNGFVHT